MRKIPAARVHFPAKDREAVLEKIGRALDSGALTMGEHAREFETRFAAHIGTNHAVSTNSGTSAIEIPLRIFGVEGREVVVPTNTFFATPAAVLHAGGTVRFADTDAETLSVSVESLRQNIGPATAGVIVVHVAGIVTPEIHEIRKLCREHGLFLFEDAAHAHGSSLDGRMAGTFGDAASFSFYPTKVITSAEGGVIVTDSTQVYGESLLYRDQGKADFSSNLHSRLGYNWRMSEPHAIIGLSQLTRLEEFIAARVRIARIYDAGLSGIPGIEALRVPAGCRTNYYKYVAFLDRGIERAAIKERLRERHGVALSGEVYELPCHLQPVFRDFGENGAFPIAEDICRRHVCLPIYPTMTTEDASYVLDALQEVLR